MKRTRVPQAARYEMIIDAAMRLFAKHGFDGVTVRELAAAVGVSDSLLFRHFPTKEAIYNAVIERVSARQDVWRDAMGASALEASTESLVKSIEKFLQCCADPEFIEAIGPTNRLTLASINGTGEYARMSYRRNFDLHFGRWSSALAAARQAGDLRESGIAPEHAQFFIEHVGTMMILMHLSGEPIPPYRASGDALAREATRFCCRGIGLSEEAIEQYMSKRARRRR